jgi:septum formation protein
MKPIKDFILASQSPRRKMLLEWAELNFEIIAKSTEEIFPESLSSFEIPIYIARQKALAAKKHIATAYHQSYVGKPIMAADTIVVLEKEIIGKPKDRNNAIEILSRLSGMKHKVITGVVILHDENEIAFSDTTEVEFHPLTMEQIEYYVDHYQPFDKAGAYAIQEWIGVIGIKAVKGDFYNVIGLPISRVVQELQKILV